MSIKDGPGEGTWSVFAEKVVAERDAAREEVARLRTIIEGVSRTLAATANGWPYEHEPALHVSQALKLACDTIEDARAEVERLRAEAKRTDEEATTLANSDLATTEQVIRALRAENERLRALLDEAEDIVRGYSPGHTVWLEAVAAERKP